jgi:hypothetical protein
MDIDWIYSPPLELLDVLLILQVGPRGRVVLPLQNLPILFNGLRITIIL